jgi:hypothetical protein
MQNFTVSLETILTQRLWNPGCHPAEPPSENDCSDVASGETPCHVMAPVTMKKELSTRSIQGLGLILTAVFLLFCGCGGGPSVMSIQPPSALSYTTATAVYIKGTAITPNNPTGSGGAVTSYSVSPALPAGMSLDDNTGIISGTPTAATAKASYTVMASNATGSTTATLTITVNAAAAGAQFIPNLNQWITPLVPQAGMHVPKSTHSAKCWARVTKGMDFSDADRVDSAVFDRILWKGMMGDKPHPAGPTGMDLRQNRKELLANYRRSLQREAAQKPKTVTN